MKILFLGSATSREMVKQLSGGSVAGNKMQVNVLECLNQYSDVEIVALSVLSIASFPNDKTIYVKKDNIKISEGLSAILIPFLNFPIIKQIWQTLSVYFEAKKILKEDNESIIFTFNLFPQQGLPLMWLKKKYNCKVVSLLADLPIDDDYERHGISKIFRKIFDALTQKSILSCDNLIVLNENAIREYAPKSNYIIVDGGVDLNEYDLNFSKKNKKTKNIVYSGALVEYNGIKNLIEAMNYIQDKNIELHIYGSGLLEDYVIKKSNELPNVKYFGKIPNDEMLKKQREAWLLVNPRPIDDPIACVTFPSKIFEYMLSGTPVLTTKLNGFTKEYYDKMFFVEDSNSKSMAKKIDEISLKSNQEIESIANKAYNFVVEYRSWSKQSERIYDFIRKISVIN